jgi:outer membrane protein assembly factor BamD (BamD/ComL family)
MKTAVVALVLLTLVGCSKPTPEEAIQRAEQLLAQARTAADTVSSPDQLPGVFAPGIEAMQSVADGYPGTPEAERALFSVAATYNNESQEFQKAIDAYQRYVNAYPGGEKAAVSMFLIGYIYNNQLGNVDSARAAYHRFLEKYPQHEMAISAQFELNNLGRSPEELLPPPPAEEKKPRVASARPKK